MGQGSEQYHNQLEPDSEKENMLIGFLMMAAFIGGSIGIVYLIAYLLS